MVGVLKWRLMGGTFFLRLGDVGQVRLGFYFFESIGV